MTFTLDLDIAASPREVFRFVADFTSTPRWYSAVQHVELVRDTGGVGTRYLVHRRLPTGPAVNTVEVTSYIDGEEIAFTSISGPTPFDYRYRVGPGPLGTSLQLDGSIRAAVPTRAARVLGPVVERLFERGMRDNLGTLKALLQQSGSS